MAVRADEMIELIQRCPLLALSGHADRGAQPAPDDYVLATGEILFGARIR
jgi:hypothetical protein